MKQRIYTGEYGRMTGAKKYPMGFASPETTKIYYPRFSFFTEEQDFPIVSNDLKWWAFGNKLYRYPLQDGKSMELVEDGLGAFLDKGKEWMLFSTHLLMGDVIRSAIFPFPVPDIRSCLSDPWILRWEQGGHLQDSPIYLPSVTNSNSWIAGRWGFSPVQFSFVRENIDYHKLEEYISKIKNPLTIQVFREKQALLKPTVISQPNPEGIYCFDFYDTQKHSTTGEVSFQLSTYGGVHTIGKDLFTHGSLTWGKGFLIPVMFQGDGTCVGLAGVNSGALVSPIPVIMEPTEKGVLLLSRRLDQPKVSGMLPVQLPCASWDKDTQGITSYPVGQKGANQGEGYATGEGLGDFSPHLYFLGTRLLRGWVPPLHGKEEAVYGGEAQTMEDWVTAGEGEKKRPFGAFVPVDMPDTDRIVDMRSLRRHLLAGKYVGVEQRNDTWWANSVSSRKDPEKGQNIQVTTTPLGRRDKGYTIEQNILPEHVIAPWCAMVGAPLEIGWWNFPQVNIQGSPPNHKWLNKTWEGEEYQWMHGGWDHHWGDIGWVRCSISVTSDCYVYITADLGNADQGGTVIAAGFKFNGTDWTSGRSDFYVSDTRVAPLGQGCYQVYHFPGEDWSIFHAPVGEVNYRRLWEPTDWSFLWALTGLAGGFALAGQLMVQEAFDKYMNASFGNLMLIYTNPRQLLAVGDPLFNQSKVIVKEDHHFWTFTGWARIDDAPHAIFSKIWGMSANNPEVWAVGKNGARQINPSEAGELGEKTFGLIPSNYYPKWGIYPGGEPLGSGWELLFPGEYYHYPMPELPQNADTALAREYLENLRAWESRAANINRPRVVVGQSFNHQLLDSAVVDPSVPLLDVRIQRKDGVTWVLLQHQSGIWFSVRGDVTFDRYDFESETGWQLLSLGVERDGTVVALFYEGLIDMDTYRTFDVQFQLYFGMGMTWQRQALWKWPARIIPVVVAQSIQDLIKLGSLFPKEEE